MHTLGELKAMLEDRGLRPKKSLGQNFLVDQNLARKLLDASGVGEGDLVLEIGPGAGALTEDLLARGCRVVACEMDDGLVDLLRDRFGDRLRLFHGDCLEGKRALNPALLAEIGAAPFTLVSNLPYAAASPVIGVLATRHPACRAMYVTVQKEVADRLGSAPGSKDYGPLTVVVQAFATVRRLATLPPECFWPRPEVTSAMIAIERRPTPLTDDLEALEAMCRALFTKRRKMLGAILGRARTWPAGVHPDQRPEELSVEQVVALSRDGA